MAGREGEAGPVADRLGGRRPRPVGEVLDGLRQHPGAQVGAGQQPQRPPGAPAPPPDEPDRKDQADEHGGVAEVGEATHDRGEPGLPVGDEEALHRPIEQRALVAGDDVLEHCPERPAGPDQGEHADGQRQAERAAGAQPAGQEGELALIAAPQPPDPWALELPVDQSAEAVGVAGDEAGGQHDPAHDHNDDEEQQAGPAGDALDLPVGAACQVTEEYEPGGPDEPTGGVPGQEGAVGHAGHAGKRGHQRAQHADETAQEHRPAALGAQVGLAPGPAVLADPAAQSAVLERLAEPAADLVADRIADHRARRPGRHHHGEVHASLEGEEAAEQHGGLPGDEQADEGGRLGGGEQPEDDVGPRAGQASSGVQQPTHRRVSRTVRISSAPCNGSRRQPA